MRALHSYLVAVSLGAGTALASMAWAQQPGGPPRGTPGPNQPGQAKRADGDSVVTNKTFRAEKLQGMKVRNPEGEELGTIEDLVLDMQSHQVRYAALSYGGFLGIGDKLFAVPIETLRLKFDGDKSYFIVDVDKETLKNAPGFAKDAWPDFANPTWMAGMEKHYGRYTAVEGTVNSAADGKLNVTDKSGREHSFNIGPNVQIVSEGDKSNLNDLRKGQNVKITTTERDGKRVVTSVQAWPERTARQPERATVPPNN
jgi:sporulation protein YlmC with PRC-barrel domain